MDVTRLIAELRAAAATTDLQTQLSAVVNKICDTLEAIDDITRVTDEYAVGLEAEHKRTHSLTQELNSLEKDFRDDKAKLNEYMPETRSKILNIET